MVSRKEVVWFAFSLEDLKSFPDSRLTSMCAAPDHTVSSGNVFEDLGLPKSDELLAKAALANQIASIIVHRHLTQEAAAKVLGTGQPKVSELLSGRLDGFSMERLIRFLNALDRDVQIVVTPKPRSRESATLRVTGRSRSAV
jgi:predicted XRE-type DNA-binding protein